MQQGVYLYVTFRNTHSIMEICSIVRTPPHCPNPSRSNSLILANVPGRISRLYRESNVHFCFRAFLPFCAPFSVPYSYLIYVFVPFCLFAPFLGLVAYRSRGVAETEAWVSNEKQATANYIITQRASSLSREARGTRTPQRWADHYIGILIPNRFWRQNGRSKRKSGPNAPHR